MLEERCERFKKLLFRNTPNNIIADVAYGWYILGEITYNDALYLSGLRELSDDEIAYCEKIAKMTADTKLMKRILNKKPIKED